MFANLNSYSKINICRLKTNKRAKRGSGGLLIFMKEEIAQGIEVIGSRLKSDDRIWLKLCARFFDTKTDVYLCCLYVSPQGSTHISSRDSIWGLLEEEITKFSQKGPVILIGDFNARTGSMPDYILHDSLECTQLPPDYIPDCPLARYSEDNILNGYGRELLNLCQGSKLRIVNGRVGLDKGIGKYTCFTKRGKSVVDYVLASSEFLKSFYLFEVGALSEVSDHCPLLFELRLKVRIQIVSKT